MMCIIIDPSRPVLPPWPSAPSLNLKAPVGDVGASAIAVAKCDWEKTSVEDTHVARIDRYIIDICVKECSKT